MISVIIPAYNAEDTLGDCLTALQAQSLARDQYEVIVVDDGSTDQTAAVAWGCGVHLIRQPHAGPAAARNRGAQAARGEILLFTDADCTPASDWIERMIEPFGDPDVAGAKGVYRTRQKALLARFVQHEYEGKYIQLSHQDRIDFVDTYSAAYRRHILLDNGGFEPLFPTASVEDQELSFRLARKGYKLVFVPQAAVYHHHDTTLGEYWRRKYGIGYWKALLLRWHPERVVRDSHTPQVLKVQIGLLGLLGIFLLLMPFWPAARWSALATVVIFGLTTVCFVHRVARQDLAAAAAVPFLMVCRALALGVGLVAGFFHFSLRTAPRRPPISGLNRALKRIVDILGSLIGLILAMPLLPLAALAIKLDSTGPVFFVQERVGENGRPFRMIKLRTMIEGAEEMLPTLVDLEALPSSSFKFRNDPRVTRVGRWLRRTSLDEVPQLWNVLKGEMSLVGPRPEETWVVCFYNDWHRQRLAVKPGLTGPMQVNGRGDLSLDERVRLELNYIQSYSLWKDLCLLARTVVATVSCRGAY